MIDTAGAIAVDNIHESLTRLYDDPERQVAELLELRAPKDVVEEQFLVFRALAHRDRLTILEALRGGEFCVCELMAILDAPQSTVATHLRKLREAGLVKTRKKGKWTYYRIADTAVMELLDFAVAIHDD